MLEAIGFIIVGTFQILSFVLIIYSTMWIRRLIGSQQLAATINSRMMALHAISCFAYILSGIVDYIVVFQFYQADEYDKAAAADRAWVSAMVVNLCEFFAQICQLIIFKNLSTVAVKRKSLTESQVLA